VRLDDMIAVEITCIYLDSDFDLLFLYIYILIYWYVCLVMVHL